MLAPSTNGLQFRLLAITSLVPHEHHDHQEAQAIADDIRRDGEIRAPILVDRQRRIILDGHHRFAALSGILKVRRAPCYLIDYDGADISVSSWRQEVSVSKQDVIAAAASGNLLPEKTSRHEVRLETPPRPTALSRLK